MSRSDFANLLGGSTFVLCCRLSGAVFAFVTQVLLARWMGAAELGTYVLAFSTCILLATIVGLGYPNAAMRIAGAALAKGELAIISGFVRWSSLTILTAGLFVAAAASIAATFGAVSRPFLIAAFCVPVFALTRFMSGVAHSHSWFSLSYVPNNVLRPGLLLAAVTCISIASIKLSADTVIATHFLIILLVASGQLLLLRRRLAPSIGDVAPAYEKTAWTRVSLPLMVTVLMSAYLPELSVLMMGMFVAPDQIAIFNASFRVALLISFGVMAVDGISMPRIARSYAAGNIDDLQTVVSRATLLKVAGSVLAVAILFVSGRNVLGLFGEEFVSGYGVMMILACAQLVTALMGAGAGILNVTGHQDSCLKVFFHALVLLAILNVVLVPKFGMTGAAISILLIVIARHAWLNRLVRQKVGVRPSVLASQNAFPLRDAESTV